MFVQFSIYFSDVYVNLTHSYYDGTACIFKGWRLSKSDDHRFIWDKSFGSLLSNVFGHGSDSEVKIYEES